MKVLLVMLGGFLGSISRFWLGTISFENYTGFPLGTLIVNLIGSLILGWIAAALKENRPRLYLLFGTGFLGGFTTFSAFSIETLNLLEEGNMVMALTYVLVTLFFGIFLSWIGFSLANLVKVKEKAKQ